MPKKQVVEYTCERCARVWYLDSKQPEPDSKLDLKLAGTAQGTDTALKYECLCESCSETVQSLVKSLAPLKPRQPRAKKKEEPADKGTPSPTDPTTTTDASPDRVSASSAAASSSASPGAGAAKAPPGAPSHQRPK